MSIRNYNRILLVVTKDILIKIAGILSTYTRRCIKIKGHKITLEKMKILKKYVNEKA